MNYVLLFKTNYNLQNFYPDIDILTSFYDFEIMKSEVFLFSE